MKKAVVFLMILIFSCTQNKRKSIKLTNHYEMCNEKFIGSYFELHPSLKKHSAFVYEENFNFPDSARKYVQCMIRLDSTNLYNYMWKIRMHFALNEYDSVIYEVDHLNLKRDSTYIPGLIILKGFAYEMKEDRLKALKEYVKARKEYNSYQLHNEPLDYLIMYFQENKVDDFQNNLVEAVNKLGYNDSMRVAQLYSIQNLFYKNVNLTPDLEIEIDSSSKRERKDLLFNLITNLNSPYF